MWGLLKWFYAIISRPLFPVTQNNLHKYAEQPTQNWFVRKQNNLHKTGLFAKCDIAHYKGLVYNI